MYLFDDVLKQKRKTFFAKCSSIRYSEICKQFDDKGVFIFPDEISKKFTKNEGEAETEEDTEWFQSLSENFNDILEKT